MSYSHRIANFDDLPEIVAIYNSTVASRRVTSDIEPVTVESRRSWYVEHTAQNRPLWVIEAERQIIGWLSFSDFYGRPAYSATAELSIYVHERMRGKGIGRYFLEQAIAHAPQIGIHSLLGFIFGHNEASLKLFEAFAFQRWAMLPRVAILDGVERDLIIVGRRVD